MGRVVFGVVLTMVMAGSCLAGEALRVLEVVDGRTLRVRKGGAVRTLRLIGVDPLPHEGYADRSAREALHRWTWRRTVTVEYDRIRRAPDGALLGYVYVTWGENTVFANARLIGEGLARAGRFDGGDIHRKEFEALSANAPRRRRDRLDRTAGHPDPTRRLREAIDEPVRARRVIPGR